MLKSYSGHRSKYKNMFLWLDQAFTASDPALLARYRPSLRFLRKKHILALRLKRYIDNIVSLRALGIVRAHIGTACGLFFTEQSEQTIRKQTRTILAANGSSVKEGIAGLLMNHVLDALKEPTLIEPQDNVYALRFESMKLIAHVTLSHERVIRGGHSHVSMYADRPGTVAAVCGTATLASYPGHSQWHQTRDVGAVVEQIGTYRARIGDVSAVGPDAATAQDRAIAASRRIEVRVA